MLYCEQCWNEPQTVFWIKKKRVCENCAANIFHEQLFRLKKQYTKLNKKYQVLKK